MTHLAKILNQITPSWVLANSLELKSLLPETGWVDLDLKFLASVGFKLKLLGLDWRSEQELVSVVEALTQLGVFDARAIQGTPRIKRGELKINFLYA